MEKYDLVVIGGGPGGYPAAIRAAQMGVSVALVEREALGGTCLNWGCIPTKTLLASAALFQELRHAARMGVRVRDAVVDYPAMAARKQQVVQKLQGGIAQLLKAHGVAVYQGAARFDSRRSVAVMADGREAARLEAGHVIIATGTVPARPAFLPRHPAVLDSRTFLDLTAMPASLLVMGGGIIGCELACLAAQLGARVTVVEMLEDILMMLDKDVRAELRRHMEKDLQIRILAGARMEEVIAIPGAQEVGAVVGGEKLTAACLLAAVGRVPDTAALDLAAAGLRANERGYIEVDANCRTRVASIFAVGDVNGGVQLAHAATAQGLAAVETIAAGSPPARRAVVPSCIFTAPEIGAVGLTEQEAAQQARAVITGKFHFAALGKALAADVPAGFVKWIADAGTGQVLGAQAIGAHATELIAEATMAVQAELTLTEVARTIHAHPTMSEAWMEAAHAALGHCVHAPPRRKG